MAKRGRKVQKHQATIPLTQCWEPPSHLSEVAREEFLRVVSLLRIKGTIDLVDSQLVARRAEIHELAVEAYRRIQTDGLMIGGTDGERLRVNPASKVLQDCSSLLRLLDASLGLVAPRDRAAPKTEPATGLDAWRARLNKGGVS